MPSPLDPLAFVLACAGVTLAFATAGAWVVQQWQAWRRDAWRRNWRRMVAKHGEDFFP